MKLTSRCSASPSHPRFLLSGREDCRCSFRHGTQPPLPPCQWEVDHLPELLVLPPVGSGDGASTDPRLRYSVSSPLSHTPTDTAVEWSEGAVPHSRGSVLHKCGSSVVRFLSSGKRCSSDRASGNQEIGDPETLGRDRPSDRVGGTYGSSPVDTVGQGRSGRSRSAGG